MNRSKKKKVVGTSREKSKKPTRTITPVKSSKANSKKLTPPTQRKSRHHYDWQPDLRDQRDFLYSEKISAPESIPPKVDLRGQCSPVFNQGQIGSCTANSLAGAIEFLELQELKALDAANSPGDPEVFTKGKFAHASRLFIYYNERAMEGTTGSDSGAKLQDGVKSLNHWGTCKESTWKYAPTNLLRKPSATAYTEAQSHTISQYLRITDLNGIKQCLTEGYPVAFGFTVYESFESPQVAKTGIMPMPDSDERVLGGHAVLAVGYDDENEQLIVRNSWGAAWGLKGYFLMPYEYIEERGLAQDFWTIRR